MNDGIKYRVYLKWKDGPGGVYDYDTKQVAVLQALYLADKWKDHSCEVVLERVSVKRIDFRRKAIP